MENVINASWEYTGWKWVGVMVALILCIALFLKFSQRISAFFRRDLKKTDDHTQGKPASETQKFSAEELRKQIFRRNQLEDQIILNLSGKTGTTALWDEIVQCAAKGNVGGFQLAAQTFLKKSAQVKEYAGELHRMIREHQTANPQNESERLLALPFVAEAECQNTLENCRKLEQSGLLTDGTAAQDALIRWGTKMQQS